MKNSVHPVELLILGLIALVEGIAWIVNELAGFHTEPRIRPPALPFTHEPDDELDEVDAYSLVFGDTAWSRSLDALTVYAQPIIDLSGLTVRELRREAKGLAKNVHMMRKAELLELLA